PQEEGSPPPLSIEPSSKFASLVIHDESSSSAFHSLQKSGVVSNITPERSPSPPASTQDPSKSSRNSPQEKGSSPPASVGHTSKTSSLATPDKNPSPPVSVQHTSEFVTLPALEEGSSSAFQSLQKSGVLSNITPGSPSPPASIQHGSKSSRNSPQEKISSPPAL
ncbi:unnamed protein product, partial [Rotaria magnacalcarata]